MFTADEWSIMHLDFQIKKNKSNEKILKVLTPNMAEFLNNYSKYTT